MRCKGCGCSLGVYKVSPVVTDGHRLFVSCPICKMKNPVFAFHEHFSGERADHKEDGRKTKNPWVNVKDELPREGQLCVVYYPIGLSLLADKSVGPIALAYWRHQDNAWVYADTPVSLNFTPFYWQPFEKDELCPPHEPKS